VSIAFIFLALGNACMGSVGRASLVLYREVGSLTSRSRKIKATKYLTARVCSISLLYGWNFFLIKKTFLPNG